jgi:hypothetical protein
MPKRHSATRKKRPTKVGRRRSLFSVRQENQQRPPSAQQQAIERFEEDICKRIVDEFGFSADSLSALRAFRQMHSPDDE